MIQIRNATCFARALEARAFSYSYITMIFIATVDINSFVSRLQNSFHAIVSHRLKKELCYIHKSNMSSDRETYQDGKKKEFLTDEFFSALSATINSGKFWRCIRWCDGGSTVLITSPVLFEREVLQREQWKLQLKVNDFASFTDLLKQVGFQNVLSQRPSKVQKFRHRDFTKNCRGFQHVVKERAEPNRKRKLSEEESLELGTTGLVKEKKENNQEANLVQFVKRQRKVTFEDEGAKMAKKRKRNCTNGEEMSAHGKKRKIAVPVTPSAPIKDDTFSKQMRRIYSEEEMTASQALLSLSTPVVFANYTAMELMAAQSLINLSRSCIVSQERSVRELEAAYTLLELVKSA